VSPEKPPKEVRVPFVVRMKPTALDLFKQVAAEQGISPSEASRRAHAAYVEAHLAAKARTSQRR